MIGTSKLIVWRLFRRGLCSKHRVHLIAGHLKVGSCFEPCFQKHPPWRYQAERKLVLHHVHKLIGFRFCVSSRAVKSWNWNLKLSFPLAVYPQNALWNSIDYFQLKHGDLQMSQWLEWIFCHTMCFIQFDTIVVKAPPLLASLWCILSQALLFGQTPTHAVLSLLRTVGTLRRRLVLLILSRDFTANGTDFFFVFRIWQALSTFSWVKCLSCCWSSQQWFLKF